jgi:hypothetical protein
MALSILLTYTSMFYWLVHVVFGYADNTIVLCNKAYDALECWTALVKRPHFECASLGMFRLLAPTFERLSALTIMSRQIE